MTVAVFISAALALLVAPGPTNALMGIAGAQHGLFRVLRLLPAELAGYLTTVLPLTYLGAQTLGRLPAVTVAMKLIAAIWVLYLALKLWRFHGPEGETARVTARKIYVTTLLNPKAFVFGLVLLPAAASADFPARIGMFCLMVAGAALLWGGLGKLTQTGSTGAERLQAVQRIAALWLGVVSISLVLGVLRG